MRSWFPHGVSHWVHAAGCRLCLAQLPRRRAPKTCPRSARVPLCHFAIVPFCFVRSRPRVAHAPWVHWTHAHDAHWQFTRARRHCSVRWIRWNHELEFSWRLATRLVALPRRALGLARPKRCCRLVPWEHLRPRVVTPVRLRADSHGADLRCMPTRRPFLARFTAETRLARLRWAEDPTCGHRARRTRFAACSHVPRHPRRPPCCAGARRRGRCGPRGRRRGRARPDGRGCAAVL